MSYVTARPLPPARRVVRRARGAADGRMGWVELLPVIADLGQQLVGSGGGSTSGVRRWMDYTPKSGEGRLNSPSNCPNVPSGAVMRAAMQAAPLSVAQRIEQGIRDEYQKDRGGWIDAVVLPTAEEIRNPQLPTEKWVALAFGANDCKLDRATWLPDYVRQVAAQYSGGAVGSPNVPTSTVPPSSGPTTYFPPTTGTQGVWPPTYTPPSTTGSIQDAVKEALRTLGREVTQVYTGPDPEAENLRLQLALAQARGAQAPSMFSSASVPLFLAVGLAVAALTMNRRRR